MNCNHLLCGSDCPAKSVIVDNLGRSGEHLNTGNKKDQDREHETFFTPITFRFTLLLKTTVACV